MNVAQSALDKMKDAVRKLVNEWDESLRLPGGTYWKIDGVTSPQTFFRCLSIFFPHGMTLLIEGLEMSLSAKSLYAEHPARYTKKVACDTISPTPDSFHVEFSPAFSDCLCRLIDSHGLAAAFYHFKGYSEREVVFMFHDAFEGELVLSKNLDAAVVRKFATALDRPVELTTFGFDFCQQLVAIDQALNPPWWKRLLRVFVRKKRT